MKKGSKKPNGSKALVKSAAAVLQKHLTPIQFEALVQPTPSKHIYQRPGRGGLVFDYVSVGYVVNKLNEVFGLSWSFNVDQVSDTTMIAKTGQIVVKGILTINNGKGNYTNKEQFGSAEIKFTKKEHKPVDIGDDFKAAASDALKKCASFVGVASDVYFRDWDTFEKPGVSNKVPTGGKVLVSESKEKLQREVFDEMKRQFKTKEAMKKVLKQLIGQDSFKHLLRKQLLELKEKLNVSKNG